ncbi:uncharacterized protein LOC144444824 [Glandiceps talaboti]
MMILVYTYTLSVLLVGVFGSPVLSYEYASVVNCTGGTLHIQTNHPAGRIDFNIPRESSSSVSCSINFTVDEGNRVVVLIESDKMVPGTDGDDCSRVHLLFSDPQTLEELTPKSNICQISGNATQHVWDPFYSQDNSVVLKVESEPNIVGRINFIVRFTSFQDVKSGECFVCKTAAPDVDFPICINSSLLCDMQDNCPDASDEYYLYTKDFGCKLTCDGKSIDDKQVCDGRQDCDDGLDESDDICDKINIVGRAPFSNMSLFDMVVSVILLIATVILLTICLYCCCNKPIPRGMEKTYVVRIMKSEPAAKPKKAPEEKEQQVKVEGFEYGRSTSV